MPPGVDGGWVATPAVHGWFPYFRFYGPTEAFYDQTWKLDDIVPLP